jgi:hypothetical protein
MRHTQVPRPAHISPSPWEAKSDRAAERHDDVLGSLRSRRAECGTHKWRARRTSRRKPWKAGIGRAARLAQGRARLAADATRRMWHTQVARLAHISPQPWPA